MVPVLCFPFLSAIGEDEHAHRRRQHGALHLHAHGPDSHGPGDQTGIWWETKNYKIHNASQPRLRAAMLMRTAVTALVQMWCDMFVGASPGVLAQRLSDVDLKREINRVWPNLSQKTVDLLVTPHKCEPHFCLGSTGLYWSPGVCLSLDSFLFFFLTSSFEMFLFISLFFFIWPCTAKNV